MTNDLTRFIEVALRIQEIIEPYGKVYASRQKAARMSSAFDNVWFGVRRDSNPLTPEQDNAIREIKKRSKDKFVELAKKDMRTELRTYASELEGLRAILPSMAAKASIAIGEYSRRLEEETE